MSLTKASYSMINGSSVNVADYGAVGNGTADDTAAIQAALNATPNYGTLVFASGNTYKTTSAITINPQALHVVIQGNGAIINAAHNGNGLVLVSDNENYSAHAIYNLNIIGPNVVYPANATQLAGTSTGAGISMGHGGATNTPAAYNCHFYNVNISQFKYGYYLQNAILCKWYGGDIEWNRYGIFVDSGQTNSNDFFGVSVRRNTYCGFYSEAHIATTAYPTNNRFFGGTFESNQPYQADTGGYPTTLLTNGEGNAVLLQGHDQFMIFEGTYFEAHSYSAWLSNASECSFVRCYFNPGSGTVTGGIRMDSTNNGCTFSQCVGDAITGCPVDFNLQVNQNFNQFLDNTGFVFNLADIGQYTTIRNNRANYQNIGTVAANQQPYTSLALLNSGLRTGRVVVSCPNATATTLFSVAAAGRYDIFVDVVANDAATYGAFATVIMDTTGRIVANNAALVVITLSGTDVKVTQSLGSTQSVKAAWTFIPCEN